jgi:hypothetical protein
MINQDLYVALFCRVRVARLQQLATRKENGTILGSPIRITVSDNHHSSIPWIGTDNRLAVDTVRGNRPSTWHCDVITLTELSGCCDRYIS